VNDELWLNLADYVVDIAVDASRLRETRRALLSAARPTKCSTSSISAAWANNFGFFPNRLNGAIR